MQEPWRSRLLPVLMEFQKKIATSKQAQVISMLAILIGPAPTAAMMQETGWQSTYSLCGFLLDSVRKRLKLKLNSMKVEGDPA